MDPDQLASDEFSLSGSRQCSKDRLLNSEKVMRTVSHLV